MWIRPPTPIGKIRKLAHKLRWLRVSSFTLPKLGLLSNAEGGHRRLEGKKSRRMLRLRMGRATLKLRTTVRIVKVYRVRYRVD